MIFFFNYSDFKIIFITLQDFKVDTFEYRLLREVSFRESLTRRFAGESDVSLSTTIEANLGPPSPPKLQHKPRNSKISENSDATFTANVGANPKPRVSSEKNFYYKFIYLNCY